MNSTHGTKVVNGIESRLTEELTRFVKLPSSLQSAFWLSVLSGAASPEGWTASMDNMLDSFLKYRWKGESPESLAVALQTLHKRKWLVTRRKEDAAYRITSPSLLRVQELSNSIWTNLKTMRLTKSEIEIDMSMDIYNLEWIIKDILRKKEIDNITDDKSFYTFFVSFFLFLGTSAETIKRICGEKTDPLNGEPREQMAFDHPDFGVSEKGKEINYRELTKKLIMFLSKRSGRRRVQVLERRVRMVKCRIEEGYEIEDLYQAVAGICYSPYHRENGYITFEIALRSGEQVEKGVGLWLLHSPIEFIEAYQERTGRIIPSREQELAVLRSQRKREAEQYARLQKVLEEKREREQKLAEREKIDRELMEIYMPSKTLEEHKARLSGSDKSQFRKEANNGQ